LVGLELDKGQYLNNLAAAVWESMAWINLHSVLRLVVGINEILATVLCSEFGW